MSDQLQLKDLILQPDFYFEEDYFYSLVYSLCCALGKNENAAATENPAEIPSLSARRRAKEIFSAVFAEGVDAAVIECCAALPDDPAKRESLRERKIEPLPSPWVEGWKRFPYAVVDKPLSYWSEACGDVDVLIHWLIFRVEGANRADLAQIFADNLGGRRVHFVSYKNNCILTSVNGEECDVVCGDKQNYCRLYDKLAPYFMPERLKRMRFVKEENMFIDSAARKKYGGTGYFEFQFCKEEGSLQKLCKGSGRYWQDDSLYVYMDYDSVFHYHYGEYFSAPTTPDGGHVFDYWGLNYYTKAQAAEIVRAIRQKAPPESEILIPWLERAATESNGFYICGI